MEADFYIRDKTGLKALLIKSLSGSTKYAVGEVVDKVGKALVHRAIEKDCFGHPPSHKTYPSVTLVT